MGLGANQVSSDGLAMSQDALRAKEVGVVVATKHKRQLEAPQVPQLRCPRCDSNNTKFCYYNNYSKSQPRHFCKSCRRHWTNGGTLRNVPIGGGRKTKRPKSSHPPTTSTSTTDHQPHQQQINMFNSCSVLDSLLSLPPIAPLNMVGSYDNTALYPLIGQEEKGVVGFGDGGVGPWQFCPSVMETEASTNNNSSYNNINLGGCWDEFSAGFFAATQPYQDLHF